MIDLNHLMIAQTAVSVDFFKNINGIAMQNNRYLDDRKLIKHSN